MQSWYRYVLVSVLAGSLLLAGPLRWTEAGEPQEKVKGTVDEVVAILANHTLPPPERRTKIRHAVPSALLRGDGAAHAGPTLAPAHAAATAGVCRALYGSHSRAPM